MIRSFLKRKTVEIDDKNRFILRTVSVVGEIKKNDLIEVVYFVDKQTECEIFSDFEKMDGNIFSGEVTKAINQMIEIGLLQEKRSGRDVTVDITEEGYQEIDGAESIEEVVSEFDDVKDIRNKSNRVFDKDKEYTNPMQTTHSPA